MLLRQSSISEAYSVLGLDQGASLEAVKTSYKQLALRTHPDKNQNNPDATVQFQQISSAYNVLLKHLDTSTPPPIPDGFSPFYHYYSHSHSYSRTHSGGHEYDEDDEDDKDESDSEDYYDSEEEYYYDEEEEEEEENLEFLMFLFEEMLNGRANRFASARFQSRRREHGNETEEQYQARITRLRKEQAAAAQRRKDQEEAWKVRRQMERENEARAGEQRRKSKAEAKRAEAEALRVSAALQVRIQQRKSQALRSAMFEAARRGDAEHVRKAIWEDGVDAAGGEVKPGMDGFVQVPPSDAKETPLHIAVVHGDLALVEWLDRHNAEADERNSQQHTAFHVALQHGHLPIIRYFLDTYPPQDSDSEPVLRLADEDKGNESLLWLALKSGEPEVVWLVLESGLADSKAIQNTWETICAKEGQVRGVFGSVGRRGQAFHEGKFEEVKDLLTSRGGFTPPPTPKGQIAEAPPSKRSTKPSHREKKINTRTQQPQHNQTPTPPESPPTSQSAPASLPSRQSSSTSQFAHASHGNARPPPGRGKRGAERGRGRGSGRGMAPSVSTHA